MLQGGRRKRRAGRMLAALLGLLAPVAVVGALYVASRDDRGATRAAPAAASAPSQVAAKPLVKAEPTPAIPLTGVDAFHLSLKKPPRAALVFDVENGDVLWRRRPLQRLPIASLTKVMTALLVTERTRPGERVRIAAAALRYRGSGVGVLPKGRRVRLEALLNGLLIVSGNDAAIALAVHVAGSERRFVRLMNRRAKALGLSCTRFVSSHGFEAGNRSCVRDLAVLTRLAMKKRRIRRIARRSQVALRFPIKGGRLFLSGHNPLIRARYPGAIGLKTGYTNEAGRCFIGVARRRGRTLGVVLLRSPNPLKHAEKMLDEGFEAMR